MRPADPAREHGLSIQTPLDVTIASVTGHVPSASVPCSMARGTDAHRCAQVRRSA